LPCGVLDDDLLLEAGRHHILSCQLFVPDGRMLSIAAGVTIFAVNSALPGGTAAIIVERGGRIYANGTASAPITFTSIDQEQDNGPVYTDSLSTVEVTPGVRGKWGGIVLAGRAPTNAVPELARIEGLHDVAYGGADPHDSSGVLRYVRIWHAGHLVGIDNELNGLTLAGVGDHTVIEFCEVAYSLDDGVSLFGGTVNVKYLSVLFPGDDAIDVDTGYRGKMQYVFVMVGAQGDHAIEMDSGTADLDVSPRTSAQFSSVTLLGAPASALGRGRSLLSVRSGSAGGVSNAVLGFAKDAGLEMQSCGSVAIVPGMLPEDQTSPSKDLLTVTSIALVAPSANTSALKIDATCREKGGGSLATPRISGASTAFASVQEADLTLESMRPEYDPLPAPGDLLCSRDVVDNQLSSRDPFFDPVSCVGAFGVDENWLKGWSILDLRWRRRDRLPRPPPPSLTAAPTQFFELDGMVTLLLIVGVLLVPFLITSIFASLQPYWQHFRENILSARLISKPFYRWAFRQGRRFTDESIDYFTRKYMAKYLRKRRKLGIDRGSSTLTDHKMHQVIKTAIAALRKKEPLAEALEASHSELPEHMRQAFAQFAKGLYEAGRTNVGLSHAKVREYWIYRGPRWLFVTTALIGSVFLVEETIKTPSHNDRMARLVTSTIGMTTACIMLYYKLPDSVRSGVCRSAHDYYVRTKKILTKEAQHKSTVASSSEEGESSDMDGAADTGPRPLAAPKRECRGVFTMAFTKKKKREVAVKATEAPDLDGGAAGRGDGRGLGV